MNTKRRRPADETFLVGLVAGKTIEQAATDAGLSERTGYRRMAEPAFRERLTRAQDDRLAATSAAVSSSMSEAMTVLRDILRDGKALHRDKVSAARSLLDFSLRFREHADLAQRLAALEQRIEEADAALRRPRSMLA